MEFDLDNPTPEEQKFLEMLDSSGPFETDEFGSLTDDGAMKLKAVISTDSYAKFLPRKDELLEKRLEFLKKNEWKNYEEII